MYSTLPYEDVEPLSHSGNTLIDQFGRIASAYAGKLAGNSRKDILKRPTCHHAIESENSKTCIDFDTADDTPSLLAVGFDKTAVGVALPLTPNNKLREHNGNGNEQTDDCVDNQEGCTSVVTCHIGKPPNVSQSDCRACDGCHRAELAGELISCHSAFIV